MEIMTILVNIATISFLMIMAIINLFSKSVLLNSNKSSVQNKLSITFPTKKGVTLLRQLMPTLGVWNEYIYYYGYYGQTLVCHTTSQRQHFFEIVYARVLFMISATVSLLTCSTMSPWWSRSPSRPNLFHKRIRLFGQSSHSIMPIKMILERLLLTMKMRRRIYSGATLSR